jgi:hypothetical protein
VPRVSQVNKSIGISKSICQVFFQVFNKIATTMLSKEAEKKLQQLEALLRQRDEINRQIEDLLIPVAAPAQASERRLEQPTPKRKGKRRGDTIVPKFTDAEIEEMIRESDEGKTAREIMREYGFKSTSDWYVLKSKYKKQHRSPQSIHPNDLPEYDEADDEEEPEDQPVVEKSLDNPVRAPKRYSYECRCGYSFKSTIPPQLIKCPDCMGKPKVVEEERHEE